MLRLRPLWLRPLLPLPLRPRPLAWRGVRRGVMSGMTGAPTVAQGARSDVMSGAQVQLPRFQQAQLPARRNNSSARVWLGKAERAASSPRAALPDNSVDRLYQLLSEEWLFEKRDASRRERGLANG